MQQFGRYQLVHRLAVGGMAEIFLARSASLDGFEKDLVIKRILPELCRDERFASMFLDEARISMSLSHPHVVQVFDFGRADNDYYLAMEYIDGCNLADLMRTCDIDGHGIDAALALLIVRDVCRGLDYAHNRKGRGGDPLNIIHRDISPQNILISFDGCAKVTDFGIAKAIGNVAATEPGMVMGKLSYLPPEQAAGQPVDPRSDVFALGLVLWEALVGKHVYDGQEGLGLFERILGARIDRPALHKPNLSKDLDAVVMKALAANPKNRFQTARAFGEAIHRHLVQHHPQTSTYDLQEFLEAHRGDLDTAGFDKAPNTGQALPGASSAEAASEPVATQIFDIVPEQIEHTEMLPELVSQGGIRWTTEIHKVLGRFRERPSLWLLVKLGDICAADQQPKPAQAAYRVAAVKFAQHGLLSQCLLCCARLVGVMPALEAQAEITRLPALAGRTDKEVAPYLFDSKGPFEDLLAELLTEVHDRQSIAGEKTPLLHLLNGVAFAKLALEAPLRKFPPDTPIVVQGDSGKTMFLIAKGRVIIYATGDGGARIYLASLAAGDFFGENSFFTGALRSATVEATYPVEVFEVDRELYRSVIGNVPAAQGILLSFYKERIVDAVLAKAPLFELLPNEDRRKILEQFDLHTFNPGQMIIEEGETSDDIFVIKSGEAEVFTTMGDHRQSLSVLGPGMLFGEVAAVRKIPRTASVVATNRVETLRLKGADFHAILAAKPNVRAKVNAELDRRVRENIDKLTGLRPALG